MPINNASSIRAELTRRVEALLDELTADIRRGLRSELYSVVNSLTGKPPPADVKVIVRATGKAVPNRKPCIIVGCGRPSKGPRFKYLCTIHRKKAAAVKEAEATSKANRRSRERARRKKAGR